MLSWLEVADILAKRFTGAILAESALVFAKAFSSKIVDFDVIAFFMRCGMSDADIIVYTRYVKQ